MSKRRNEVEAAMHSVVHYVSSIQPTLIMEVSFKLIVDVLDDGLKTEIKYRTSRPPQKIFICTSKEFVSFNTQLIFTPS